MAEESLLQGVVDGERSEPGVADDSARLLRVAGGDEASVVVTPENTWGSRIVSLLCGMAFGFVLHKAGVYRASVIIGQFNFTHFRMLKMFLTAATTSTLSLTTMYYSNEYAAEKATPIGQDYEGPIGVPLTALGGALLGLGMAVAGCCPGTLWVQLGAGSYRSLVALGGGAASSVLFAYLKDPWINKASRVGILPRGKRTIHGLLGVSRLAAGLGFAAMLAIIVVLLEVFLPEHGEATHRFDQVTWSPVLCGAVVGLLQIPLLLLVGDNLGSSSSVLWMVANTTSLFNCAPFKTLHKFKSNPLHWQIILVLAAALGSFLAYKSSPEDALYNIGEDVSLVRVALGGALVLFGARLADGCTSGHGITGMGHLTLRSLIAVGAMFGTAILSSLVIHHA